MYMPVSLAHGYNHSNFFRILLANYKNQVSNWVSNWVSPLSTLVSGNAGWLVSRLYRVSNQVSPLSTLASAAKTEEPAIFANKNDGQKLLLCKSRLNTSSKVAESFFCWQQCIIAKKLPVCLKNLQHSCKLPMVFRKIPPVNWQFAGFLCTEGKERSGEF